MAGAGGAFGALLLLVFLGLLIMFDQMVGLACNVWMIILVMYCLLGIGAFAEVVVQCIKDKNYKELLIFIISLVIFALIPFENFYKALFGYKLYPIIHRFVVVGILSWILCRIYRSRKGLNDKNYKIFSAFLVIVVVGTIILHFTLGIDKTIFETVPQVIAEHNEEWYTERTVRKYTPKKELEVILEAYKENPSLEFSREKIAELDHEQYNGIWCSLLEEDETSYTIQMAYKSQSGGMLKSFWQAIFPDKNFSKYGEYKVDKTTFDITEVKYENFKGGKDYKE